MEGRGKHDVIQNRAHRDHRDVHHFDLWYLIKFPIPSLDELLNRSHPMIAIEVVEHSLGTVRVYSPVKNIGELGSLKPFDRFL